MLTVILMNESTVSLYNQTNNRYAAGELVSVLLTDSGFSLEYLPLKEAEWHAYPPDSLCTARQLLKKKGAVCFFAFMDGQPVGQAIALRNWNQLALLWDIRVDAHCRRKGVGRALLSACAGWARQQGLKGLVAETQDVNPTACRFYQSNGFVLGGVDRMLYAATPQTIKSSQTAQESALFFYLLFD
jgi:streptothricin acetyltransferase